ncbi:type II secretion system protein GspG [Luteolibacter flavescens]|uniref:Type II secretion system protein GspG n=1 Tax=Luteolibacter flavescens TaxID=1859460 RepID=A0ABT3FRU5_9BACT|nr:type II secretion system protein GspG [Luteolibacter flavescens]MCW1886302.1 type II secretion system protein GspG [Luteolibacter flavescens]
MGKFLVMLLVAAVCLAMAMYLGILPSRGGIATVGPIDGDMASMSSALNMFRVNAGRYPTEEEGLAALIEKPATYPENKRWQKIMGKLPLDPWNNPYQYVAIKDSEKMLSAALDLDAYGLYSFGPDGISKSQGNDDDDRNSWNELSLDRRSSFERWKDSFQVDEAGIILLALFVCFGFLRALNIRAKA